MCNLGINVDNYNPKILYTFEKKFYEGQTTKVHTHDFLSITYLLSGACTYTINDIPYKGKKGDILILNPNVPHGKISVTSTDLVEFHAGFENIQLKCLPKNFLISETATPILTSPKYEPDFLKCCNDILSEQSKNEPGSELLLKSLGMKLIVILLRATHENKTNREKGIINFDVYDKTVIVNTITEFINENYMKELSLDIISQNMYLSPAYISKLFKEETGESPINYLIKVRLSKAEDYLKASSFSIKEAAHAVGYEDAYHFSKLFKKYYGYPPSSIKKSRNGN
jgi:AraC-like DNA-binding protein